MGGTIAVLTGLGPACDQLGAWLEAQAARGDVVVRRLAGNQIAWQRNRLAAEAMADGWGDFVLYVDADMVPPPAALDQLLDADVALIGGVAIERRSPFNVCAVRSLDPYQRYALRDLPGAGIMRVTSVGAGFLLVRRSVFEAVQRPWFRCGDVSGGEDVIAEDLGLSLRAGDAGYPAHLHCGVRVGHVASVTLWPGSDGAVLAQWDGGTGDRLQYKEPLGFAVVAGAS